MTAASQGTGDQASPGAASAGAGRDARSPLTFLTAREASIIDAIAARIIPGDDADPGAREAQVTTYIDRALAGYFSSLQVFYREGIDALEKLCMVRHGTSFTDLPAPQQDEILRVIEGRTAGDKDEFPAQFFAVVYEHILEGMFGDPVHGGNRNAVGWKLIGFPGAQWGYSPAAMAAGFNATTLPIKTLADLQAEGRTTHPISLQWPPTAT